MKSLKLVFALAPLAFAAGALALHKRAAPIPVLGSAPAFTRTAQDGAEFKSERLAGHPWVANFVFTRCTTVCPPFSAKMAAIAGKVPPGVKLISFSVDPEHDTPPVLETYARGFKARPEQWSFLTGARSDLEAVIVKGLFQPMEKGDGSLISIGHSSRFVLVDAKGQIRGFYASQEADAVERVVADARRVMEEK
jgi:protein SCO1